MTVYFSQAGLFASPSAFKKSAVRFGEASAASSGASSSGSSGSESPDSKTSATAPPKKGVIERGKEKLQEFIDQTFGGVKNVWKAFKLMFEALPDIGSYTANFSDANDAVNGKLPYLAHGTFALTLAVMNGLEAFNKGLVNNAKESDKSLLEQWPKQFSKVANEVRQYILTIHYPQLILMPQDGTITKTLFKPLGINQAMIDEIKDKEIPELPVEAGADDAGKAADTEKAKKTYGNTKVSALTDSDLKHLGKLLTDAIDNPPESKPDAAAPETSAGSADPVTGSEGDK